MLRFFVDMNTLLLLVVPNIVVCREYNIPQVNDLFGFETVRDASQNRALHLLRVLRVTVDGNRSEWQKLVVSFHKIIPSKLFDFSC